MANEAKIGSYLSITKNNLKYRSAVSQITEDVSGTKGPTPGAITVTTEGTDVDLSELTAPGLCEITNLDSTNYVRVGIYDPESNLFYPFIKVNPGKKYILMLDENFGVEYVGTGTGTGPETNRLRIKANNASCVVQVNTFEA